MSWFVINLRKSFALAIAVGCLFYPLIGRCDSSGMLRVVATNSIVADWVRNIAGDQINLVTLVGANADVHTFEPTPSDDIILAKSDIIFEIGFGLEHWMDKLYAASASKAKRIVLTDGVVTHPLNILRLGREHHQDSDPHVWQNVRYVMGIVKRINSALKSADLAHAAIYEANTQAYLKQLQDLDAWIIRKVTAIPRESRQLVTNHDTLGYFCERYQFKLVGAAFESVTTEAEDPSAKDMAELIFRIKTTKVRVIFAENTNNSKYITSLAQEAKVELAPPLFTDALGTKESQADTYIHMMRYNVDTIILSLFKSQ